MNVLSKGQTNCFMGNRVDVRLLIINADDFGICNWVNEVTIFLNDQTLQGVWRNTMCLQEITS